MIAFTSCSLIAGSLEPAIAAYALRLFKIFGSRRVGWSVFATFFLLTLLHLVQSVAPPGAAPAALGSVGTFVVLLLLVGMAHTEAYLAEHVRTERRERALSSELEQRAAENAELRIAYHSLLEQSSERACIHKLLEQSEHLYRSVFTNHPQPMWIYDLRAFCFLAVNDATLRQFGFTRQEFLAMDAKHLRPPEDVPAFVRESATPALEARLCQRCRIYRQDRTLAQIETISFDLEFGGSPARLVIVQDLSHYRLVDEQMRQAERVEATGRLARGIAHHFNNLITPVLGYTTVLLDRIHERDTVSQLKRIALAAQDVSSLTRRLLALGHSSPAQITLRNVKDLVADAEEAIDRLVGNSVTVRKSYAPLLPPVRVDPVLIRQVLIDLVQNACEAMESGGCLQITATSVNVTSEHVLRHPEARLGEFVCLSVSDTGRGMTPTVREHLFEPFFTTKEVGKGVGLGLAAAYYAVRQHNGWIEVTTQPGVGSEFRLFLPPSAAAWDQQPGGKPAPPQPARAP